MSHNFKPEDLDETFIDEIYEDCLTDEKHISVPVEVLRPDMVKNRSGVVRLDPFKVSEYSEYIDYMFGQIRAFHDTHAEFMSFREGFINYLNNYWTEDMDTILKLYALGIVNGSIYPFAVNRRGIIITAKDMLMIPTLDTFDPKFPEWFETVYKKEYRPRRKIVRE